MISRAGRGGRRATIGVPSETTLPSIKRQLSQTRTLQRRATITTSESKEVTRDTVFDGEQVPVGPSEKPDVEASSPGTESVAVALARKHRLTLAETKNVVNAFKHAKRNSANGIDLADFRTMMCSVFDVSDINPAILVLAHEQAGMQENANLEDFMAWYFQNMFTQVNALNANQTLHQNNSLIYALAEKHMVTVSVIDKIRGQFDRFDLDKNGKIDFEEFTNMMCILLKTNRDSLRDARARKFWREMEATAGGDVAFAGFTAWYLKYFSPDPSREDDNPVEAMYASFNPSVLRQTLLDSLEA